MGWNTRRWNPNAISGLAIPWDVIKGENTGSPPPPDPGPGTFYPLKLSWGQLVNFMVYANQFAFQVSGNTGTGGVMETPQWLYPSAPGDPGFESNYAAFQGGNRMVLGSGIAVTGPGLVGGNFGFGDGSGGQVGTGIAVIFDGDIYLQMQGGFSDSAGNGGTLSSGGGVAATGLLRFCGGSVAIYSDPSNPFTATVSIQPVGHFSF